MTPGLLELEKRAADWPVPGLQVAVVRSGEVLFAGGFGECTPQTLMHHGSCGKAYTSTLAALLADEGRLDLDEPVREYVPEFRTPDPYLSDRITTRDLLSHRSGLGRHDFTWILHPEWDAEELLRRLPHLAPAGELRYGMQYSNIGYSVAGLAIGRAGGGTFAAQLRERVLVPLGMHHTNSDSQTHKGNPYVLEGDRVVPTQWRSSCAIAPAGELVTNAGDAAQWLLLQAGAEGSAELRAAARATQRSMIPLPPEMSPWPELRLYGYGLGWLVGTFRDRPAVLHAGGIDGFLTETIVLPEDGIGVTVSANVHMSDLPLPASLALVDSLLEGDFDTDWYARSRQASPRTTSETETAAPASRPPTQPVACFVGTYRHPGYGDLVVTEDGDGLSVTLGDGSFDVTHRRLDTWEIRYRPLDATFPLTFATDSEGVIAEALVPFDDGTPVIRFARSHP